ncbi:MAG: TatD family hydrolase [Bacteroidales bacterium]|nr:TatD family hydrolase [Bacteroidales bacterium]
MYIDIHRHSKVDTPHVLTVQNLYPNQAENIGQSAFSSAGLHPWNIEINTLEKDFQDLIKLSADPAVIAIGETGLDKTISVDYNLQLEVFQRHLNLAREQKKPLIIHCVRSYSEMLGLKKQFGLEIPWIFHWFNSSLQTAKELISKNCYLSFGHMLFKDQSKAYSVFRDIPLNRLFLETDDAGFSIIEVYQQAASIRNVTVEKLKQIILSNFKTCFEEIL